MEENVIEIKKEKIDNNSMYCVKDCSVMFDGKLYSFKKDSIYNFGIEFKKHLYYNNLLNCFVEAKKVEEKKKHSEDENGEDSSKVVSKGSKKN